MESKSFFNLPAASLVNGHGEKSYFGPARKHAFETNWKTVEEQEMSKQSLFDVFSGSIPVIRQKKFLSQEECEKMVGVLKSHEILKGVYDVNHVWPRVGCVGIAQTDHVNDKETYFSKAEGAYSLQNRWKEELGIDVMERVAQSLREASGMVVRRARENEKDYFAGVIRAIDTGIQIHADYAPFEGNGWEIGGIAAQMSWNILLNPVPGGDTFIFDRQWQAPQDDIMWRKDYPKYAYEPRMVEGRAFKVVKPVPGDLYWFNPRNFHEVRGCDIAKDNKEQRAPTRYTVSSFVGFLPAHDSEPDTIVLWS
ncbi:putative Prolyl 4-hydroxylase alpha subunit Fe(2+) 2OG dioxygenase domain-containing protein [Seiridium unicorne]|uniref:Prolyl 4-hydroxylase alpha subunit Fe(2+) 2OG dioxygenase domain-containing protein n=1 Tax=Seiridium unicorne TaxID=138068 RepID=A0ABR2UV02_9PEZI